VIAASPERPNSERDDRLSTRDLLGYMLCRHATWRDIRRTISPGQFEAPIQLHDDLRNLRSLLGQKHELQWVEELKRRGVEVESLSKKDGTVAREARTREAMAAGVPAIHGGVLATDNWLGEPDLLIRRDVFDLIFRTQPDAPSALSEPGKRHLYEVADIKLKALLNKRGPDHARSFLYTILETAPTTASVAYLTEREQYWMHVLGSKANGLNS
jgi:hypothetical protein